MKKAIFSPPVEIYVKKTKNRITFKIKSAYDLEVLIQII